jgi:hypothetical protein
MRERCKQYRINIDGRRKSIGFGINLQQMIFLVVVVEKRASQMRHDLERLPTARVTHVFICTFPKIVALIIQASFQSLRGKSQCVHRAYEAECSTSSVDVQARVISPCYSRPALDPSHCGFVRYRTSIVA